MNWFKNAWYWKLAIFECFSDAFITGAMVWMAAVANQNWEDLPPTAKTIIKLSVLVAVVKTIKSFTSTTMQVLKDNRPDELPPAVPIVPPPAPPTSS